MYEYLKDKKKNLRMRFIYTAFALKIAEEATQSRGVWRVSPNIYDGEVFS